MLEVIKRILTDYGDETFRNMQRTHAILLDLAPAVELKRERILVRNFIEMNGYAALKDASADYPMLEKKLAQAMIDMFVVEKQAALWTVQIFAAALGFLHEQEVSPLNAVDMDSSEKSIARFTDGYLQGQVAIGRNHVAAVSTDGTVFAAGGNDHFECDVRSWQHIVAVAAGDSHTLGLRQDGTVLAVGSNAFDQCDVAGFSNVRVIYAFKNDSICVMADGTAVAVGSSQFNLEHFSNIVAIAPYPEGIIGIKADGTLTFTGDLPLWRHLALEITEEDKWLTSQTGVAQAVSTYINGSIIRTKDGRIYKSNQHENYFTQWRNVQSIVNLADCFAILGKDGTVKVLPYNRENPRIPTHADNWRDIKAIFGGHKRLIGLTTDGYLKVAYTDMAWLTQHKEMSINYVTKWYPVGIDT